MGCLAFFLAATTANRMLLDERQRRLVSATLFHGRTQQGAHKVVFWVQELHRSEVFFVLLKLTQIDSEVTQTDLMDMISLLINS